MVPLNQNIKGKGREPIEILLIEDNLGDNRLTIEIFKEAEVPNHIQTVTNGVDAMDFLNQERKFTDATHPDLINTGSQPTQKGWSRSSDRY